MLESSTCFSFTAGIGAIYSTQAYLLKSRSGRCSCPISHIGGYRFGVCSRGLPIVLLLCCFPLFSLVVFCLTSALAAGCPVVLFVQGQSRWVLAVTIWQGLVKKAIFQQDGPQTRRSFSKANGKKQKPTGSSFSTELFRFLVTPKLLVRINF